MAAVGQHILRLRKADSDREMHVREEAKRTSQSVEDNSVKHLLKASEIELVLGKQLASNLVQSQQELGFRMGKMRKKFALEYGYVIPEVKVSEDFAAPAKNYLVKVHGTVVASHEVRLDEVLALVGNGPLPDLPGELVKEPAFGMRALSVPKGFSEDLRRLNIQYVDTVSVILTHISEVVRTNLSQLFSYRDMRTLIDRLDPEYRKLADDICTTHLTYPGLQAVLKSLLSERVSIRNLHLIIEAIAEVAPHMRRTEKIVEHVRIRISQQLCGDIAQSGPLNVLRLGTRWDMAFHESLRRDGKGEILEFEMDPRTLEKFAEEAQLQINKHLEVGIPFAVLTAQDARPFVRMIIERVFPGVPVLSHAEIARGVTLHVIDAIS